MNPSRINLRARAVWIAIGLSCALHGLAYAWFGWTWRTAPPISAGVVSVEFVEPVVHEARGAVPLPKPKKSLRSRPAKNKSPGAPTVTEPDAPVAPTSARPAPGVGSVESALFKAEVTRLINEQKSYPRAALAREWEGRVVVAITLDRDGSLRAATVEEPATFAVLNAAALDAVRSVRHFPALPASAGESLHLHVPIAFKMARR